MWLGGSRAAPGEVEGAMPPRLAAAHARQREVLRDGHGGGDAPGLAVVRNGSDSGPAQSPRIEVRRVDAVDRERAAGDRHDPGQDAEQLLLSVAGDARDAEDFAGAHRKRDVVDRRDARRRVRRQAAHLEAWRLRAAVVDRRAGRQRTDLFRDPSPVPAIPRRTRRAQPEGRSSRGATRIPGPPWP